MSDDLDAGRCPMPGCTMGPNHKHAHMVARWPQRPAPQPEGEVLTREEYEGELTATASSPARRVAAYQSLLAHDAALREKLKRYEDLTIHTTAERVRADKAEAALKDATEALRMTQTWIGNHVAPIHQSSYVNDIIAAALAKLKAREGMEG